MLPVPSTASRRRKGWPVSWAGQDTGPRPPLADKRAVLPDELEPTRLRVQGLEAQSRPPDGQARFDQLLAEGLKEPRHAVRAHRIPDEPQGKLSAQPSREEMVVLHARKVGACAPWSSHNIVR
jgi:hypothetical protein